MITPHSARIDLGQYTGRQRLDLTLSTICPYSHNCVNDSSICGYFEGITASGEAILCSFDCTEDAV
jgi:hypothetical protein